MQREKSARGAVLNILRLCKGASSCCIYCCRAAATQAAAFLNTPGAHQRIMIKACALINLLSLSSSSTWHFSRLQTFGARSKYLHAPNSPRTRSVSRFKLDFYIACAPCVCCARDYFAFSKGLIPFLHSGHAPPQNRRGVIFLRAQVKNSSSARGRAPLFPTFFPRRVRFS
jgi:hypothetical protein